ncbi:lantibiotic dehydratase C-terminal domain-containing protein [Kitasatospora sp. NPDC059571]|uniref:lantibiotic dehydratase C-terminal domain-containing protein n=1 Tax=Kitasatospora sp. NPDC059571 TaxID=3346871 RepID=UPI0036A124D2
MTAPAAHPLPDPLPGPAAAGAGPGDWIAVHVFYAAGSRPLLLECVRPLVRALAEDGLLAGFFFINYWLHGPHLRLRLRPSSPAAAAEVRARTEEAVAAFLRARPALYAVEGGFFAELYENLFRLEFAPEEREALLGPDGRMALRPNNSYSFEPYEPEFGKYGGPAGVALAEWHFRHSSELVIETARSANLHLRTVLLGTAAQLMMVMAATFLPADDEELVRFLERYHAFWDQAFADTDYTARRGYDRAYEAMGADLGRRFGQVRAAVAGRADERLPPMLRGWAGHCRDLVSRAAELASAGALDFDAHRGGRLHVTDPAQALPMLLFPYLHMTNNRLSVTVRDEAFLSYVLARSLREAAAPATGAR